MQELQPLMKNLREKYANDKQKLNQEVWRCIRQRELILWVVASPMVIQIPVFFCTIQRAFRRY
jgi:YidC/Oxa1 family membrane protein insertase